MQAFDICVKELKAKVVGQACVGEYQGTKYWLLEKDGKYAIVQYHYGSCSHCDWEESIRDMFHQNNEDHPWNAPYPDEIYRPIVDDMKDQAKFMSKGDLLAQFHMLFGVGVDDKRAENHMREFLA